MKKPLWIAAIMAATLASSNAFAVGNVVISQIYGGGGNTGAQWQNDYVEIFNRTAAPVNIGGWAIQYASAAGTTWATQAIPAGTVLPAGGYGLIKLASGGAVGSALNVACQVAPAPPAAGTINMSATAGKVALTNTSVALAGACPVGGTIVDFVGYGATASCSETTAPADNAPAGSNTTALQRKNAGGLDTDRNANDFVVGSPVPCSLPTPNATHTWGGLKTIYR